MAKKLGIWLAEHGQTHFDKDNLVHGHLQVGLDATGKKQAKALGVKLAKLDPKPSRIDASDLKRAAQTAKIAGSVAGIPVRLTPGLRSLDVGHMVGTDEKQASDKLKPYFDHPEHVIPGGESVQQWRARHLGFMKKRISEASRSGDTPLIVSHSNTLGSIQAAAEGTEDGRKAMAHPPKSASFWKVRFPVGARRLGIKKEG